MRKIIVLCSLFIFGCNGGSSSESPTPNEGSQQQTTTTNSAANPASSNEEAQIIQSAEDAPQQTATTNSAEQPAQSNEISQAIQSDHGTQQQPIRASSVEKPVSSDETTQAVKPASKPSTQTMTANAITIRVKSPDKHQTKVPFAGQTLITEIVTEQPFTGSGYWDINKEQTACPIVDSSVCEYTIRPEDEGEEIKFCIQEGTSTICAAQSFALPKVSFTGKLDYRSTIEATVKNFSEQATYFWEISNYPSQERLAMDNLGYTPLSENTLNFTFEAEHIQKFMYFCIEDHKNDWDMTCINLGNDSNIENGLLLYTGEPRRIGPVYSVDVPHWRDRYRRIYRPLTIAELAQKNIIINKDINIYDDREFHRLPYLSKTPTVHNTDGSDIISSGDELCTVMGKYVTTFNTLSKVDFKDLQWPDYWNYWTSSKSDVPGSQLYLQLDPGDSSENPNSPYYGPELITCMDPD